ncbi:TonB-dependent receptor [Parahaliea mediterranea]|uniref:TonB-dependent receptor n=1 Tax=Parahaliea mediterranea TaxID=651086 RepID=A0A939DF29_9GAMM|nr:TonB-dependent receptor [Parahaliea mediterranea]MBN7796984.1 TonB-dependent receptor [Parahaliea mediterranea]
MTAIRKTPTRKTIASAISLALATTALTQTNPALAQQLVLEEVIVTAQKRAQSLQDVPISVAAMTGDKIDDTGITSLEELTLYVPNVSINSGANTPNLFIRGIGSGTNAGFEQSVGMYIDGVYAGRGPLAAVPTTMDLERVEILKGPQGILFGKNTIAGAINITTAKPSQEFEGMAEALYAPDHGEEQYNLVLSGPLGDTLYGRIAARYDAMDGWWDNELSGKEGPDLSNTYVRGSLLWEASDTIEVHAKYELGDFSRGESPSVVYQSDFAGQENFAGDVPFPVISDRDEGAVDFEDYTDTDTDVAAVTLNWDLDFATFTSITAYSAYEFERGQNSDLTATAAIHRTMWEDYEQFSQELRLVSPGGDTIDWIAGAYFQSAELDISRRNHALDMAQAGPLGVRGALVQTQEPVPSVFDQESESWAVFGQATWNVADSWRVTGGLRYNEESKDLDKVTQQDMLGIRFGDNIFFANPLNGQYVSDLRAHEFTGLSRDEDKWTFSLNTQWDATDNAMIYASVSTGFKGGGYDESYSNEGTTIRLANPITGELTGESVPGVDPSVIEYADEEVLAYELGAKMSLLDGAAELNVALFRMEYDNLQTSSLVGDVFRVGNAGEAISQGLEIDGRWLVTERLTIGGAVAYLDAYYDDFTGATCTIPQTVDPANNPGCLDENGSNITVPLSPGGQDLTDETLLFAPEWSTNLNAQYVMPIGDTMELLTSVDINYNDELYSALDLDPDTVHDAYTLVNARIALASIEDTWTVALIGKNLTDEETYLWKNDVPATNSNSYFAIPERPRSLAVQVRYRF